MKSTSPTGRETNPPSRTPAVPEPLNPQYEDDARAPKTEGKVDYTENEVYDPVNDELRPTKAKPSRDVGIG